MPTQSTTIDADSKVLIHRPFEDIEAMLTGAVFMTFGVMMFGKVGILTGGTPGIAFLIHYATGWNFGAVLFLANLPFYILAWRKMGAAFTLKTVCSVGLVAVLVNVLPQLVSFEKLSPLFAALMGGLLMGVGILILFRHRASLGGLNVLALYLQERFGWRAGNVQMCIDGLILVTSFGVIEVHKVLLSVIGAFILNQTLAVNHRTERYVAH